MTKCYLCDGDAPPADAGRPPVCERCDPRPSEAPEGLATLRAIMTALGEHEKRTSWVSWPGVEAPLRTVEDVVVPPTKEPTVLGIEVETWRRALMQLEERFYDAKPQPVEDLIVPEAVKQTAEIRSTCARCGRILFHWRQGMGRPLSPTHELRSLIDEAQREHDLHCPTLI